MATTTQTSSSTAQPLGGDHSNGRSPCAVAERIPPLENGDHLSAEEFERRYQAMPDTRAELIEGVVYVASPVSADHGVPHIRGAFWLEAYRSGTLGVEAAVDGTVRLNDENRPQPDGYIRILEAFGGKSAISPDRFVTGAPEFVLEIARSSASYDLFEKLDAYRRNEVLEYVVWRVDDGQIDWFALSNGSYEPLVPTADGIYKSTAFPGLWLDPAALIRGDTATVLRVVQEGLASPEHAAFVAKLAAEAARLAASKPEEPRP